MDTEQPPKAKAKSKPTLWHQSFAGLVAQRAPLDIEVQPEVTFRSIPNRPDLLLLRRSDGVPRNDEARILRGLWPHIDRVALVEFKSPARQFRRNGLIDLTIYGRLFHRDQRDLRALGKPYVLEDRGQLTLVLVIPGHVQALDDELEAMGWEHKPLGSGYARIVGPLYTTILASLDEVSVAENDEYLKLFSNHSVTEQAALFWWNRWHDKVTMEKLENVEGSDELFAKLLESLPAKLRLAGLPPEIRLAGLPPEQRLAGLPPEQRLAGLSPDELKRLRAAVDEKLKSPK